MPDAIAVTESVRIPGPAMIVRAMCASGPGGQNVNKVATKVELRVNLDAIEGFDPPAGSRLVTRARPSSGSARRLRRSARTEHRREKEQ